MGESFVLLASSLLTTYYLPDSDSDSESESDDANVARLQR